jgi:hypothetical protein
MSARSNISPYAAATVIERQLAKHGIDEDVRPQWLYGYAKRGIIAAQCELGSEGHRTHAKCTKMQFDGDAFYAWLVAYVGKRLRGETGRSTLDYDALTDEFDVESV